MKRHRLHRMNVIHAVCYAPLLLLLLLFVLLWLLFSNCKMLKIGKCNRMARSLPCSLHQLDWHKILIWYWKCYCWCYCKGTAACHWSLGSLTIADVRYTILCDTFFKISKKTNEGKSVSWCCFGLLMWMYANATTGFFSLRFIYILFFCTYVFLLLCDSFLSFQNGSIVMLTPPSIK